MYGRVDGRMNGWAEGWVGGFINQPVNKESLNIITASCATEVQNTYGWMNECMDEWVV